MGWKLKSSRQKGASFSLNIGNLLGSGFLSLLEAFGVAGMHILFMNQKKSHPTKEAWSCASTLIYTFMPNGIK